MSELYSPNAHVEINQGVTDPKHAISSCKRKATVSSRHIKVDELADAMQPAHTSAGTTPATTQNGELFQMKGSTSAAPAALAGPLYGVPQPEAGPAFGPQSMQLQTFTSIVAAAAAAGAMAAIRELPVAHALARNGTPEQNAAFMAAANAAASAAAAQAVALTPVPPPAQPRTATPPPTQEQPPPQARFVSEPPAVPPAVQQPPQPPAPGAALQPAASDTSAHQPPQPPSQEHVDLQAAAQAPSGAAARTADASPFEQALIKRLQLYAWLVRHLIPPYTCPWSASQPG